jgi:hypothetical protein
MKQTGVWTTRGFDEFSQGTCGNAGQNLYVSRAGVLQRIHQFDLNKNGYVDLVFCNSQNHWEKPPAYVYQDPLTNATRVELPSDGAQSGVVADLNGNGYDDLVLGMWYNGIRRDLNAFIYYGSPDGWSERRHQQLPAPSCTSVAAGDLKGSGRTDLVFLCDGKVRVFYQSDLGFEPKRFVDLEIEGEQLAVDDLDGDGCADLIVRSQDGKMTVYWGSGGGIHPGRATPLPLDSSISGGPEDGTMDQAKYPEYVEDAALLVKVIRLAGVPHLFAPRAESVSLVPVNEKRQFGAPLALACSQALSIAAGDVNGNGHLDLVLACRQPYEGFGQGAECSWIYWGSDAGFDEKDRTRLPSQRACDVAVGDLDGDGFDDIILCQGHTAESFTAESLIYRGATNGSVSEPVRLVSEDARRVLLASPCGDGPPSAVFVNYFARNLLGNIDASIYFGGPDGYSPERRRDVPAWGAVEAICCDMNDDGLVDLVLANAAENSVSRDPGSYVLFNSPNGLPDEPSLRLPTLRAHGVCCADLNRDGCLDLVFCGFDNPEIVIFYGTAGGFDTQNPDRVLLEHEGFLYNEPRWLYLADLNNNGWLDLVVPQISYDRSLILWGGADGFSMERSQVLSVVRAGCVRAADLTGNGYLDLIVGGHMPDRHAPHDSFVYIYWNGPDGLREDNRAMLPAKTINAMAVADFNNNGLLDIFICSYHDIHERDVDSYLYWNREGEGFSAADRTRLFTHSASGCVAVDLNENGWTDLAIAYHKVWGDHVGHSAIWWNGPDGFTEGRVTKLPSSGPHGMTSIAPGNIVDRGPEEYYTSAPFELPEAASVSKVSWEAEIPPKTWVKAQLKSAATEVALEKAAWKGPGEGDAWFDNGQEAQPDAFPNRWVQYRLALGAVAGGSTPRVTAVSVHYDRG